MNILHQLWYSKTSNQCGVHYEFDSLWGLQFLHLDAECIHLVMTAFKAFSTQYKVPILRSSHFFFKLKETAGERACTFVHLLCTLGKEMAFTQALSLKYLMMLRSVNQSCTTRITWQTVNRKVTICNDWKKK